MKRFLQQTHLFVCIPAKVANWLPRPGKAKVTYAEGSSFEGVFNGERIKEGSGKYTWMKPAEEDGEDPQVHIPCRRTFATCRVCRVHWADCESLVVLPAKYCVKESGCV